jgi:hypothetical protein
MRNEKIIQAIAAYLGKVMTYNNSLTKIQFERTCVNGAAKFIEQEATYIAAAIAPHLEVGAGWEDAPEWANYKTKDPDGSVFFWELEPQKKEDFWSQNANGGRFIVIGVDSWEELHQRPG